MLWVQLPVTDADPFVASARGRGVAVLAGAATRSDVHADPHLRISTTADATTLHRAIDELVACWGDFSGPEPARRARR
jgi:hypothetical protein